MLIFFADIGTAVSQISGSFAIQNIPIKLSLCNPLENEACRKSLHIYYHQSQQNIVDVDNANKNWPTDCYRKSETILQTASLPE